MSNLTDKDIDHLSREAAEMFEPDDSILSWSKLEHALSNTIPDKPPGGFWTQYRLRPFIYGSMIVLVSGITYLLIKTRQHKTFSTPTILNTVSALKDRPLNSRNADASNQGSDQKDQSTVALSNAALNKSNPSSSLTSERSGNSNSTSTEKYTRQKNAAYTSSKKQKNHRGQQESNNLWDGTYSYMDLISNPNPPGTLNDKQMASSGMQPAAEKSRIHGSLPAIVSIPSGFILVRGNDSSLLKFAAASKSPSKPQRTMQVKRPLTLGLVIGPDLSEVGGLAPDVLSNNAGLSLGYHLMNRLSLNSGLIFTKKNYWTTGKDFNAPYIPLAAILHLDFVNGNCNMIEIPLTLRYDFPAGKNTMVFVNGGASSYLMQKESYTYYYSRGLEWKGNNNKSKNYLFSVVDISAGVERDLGKGFSFQVEPFLRIPTTGIGFGKVQLNSYGMLFSLRYAPVLGRSKK